MHPSTDFYGNFADVIRRILTAVATSRQSSKLGMLVSPLACISTPHLFSAVADHRLAMDSDFYAHQLEPVHC